MDLATVNPITKTIVTLFLELYSDQSTSLKPPLPTFPLSTFDHYISDINYSQNILTQIPELIRTDWEHSLFTRQKQDIPDINEHSLKGMAMKALVELLNSSEENAKKKALALYNSSFDEIDRATFPQLVLILKNYVPYIGKLFTKHGKFVSLIGQELHSKAGTFAFYEMSYHQAKLNAYFHLLSLDACFISTHKAKINSLLVEELKHYKEWSTRWKACENISYLLFNLEKGLHLIQDQDLKTYHYTTYKLIQHLSLVKVAFKNHIIDIKPKSEYEFLFESYVNQGVSWLNNLLSSPTKCPSYDSAFENASKFHQETYDSLYPEKRITASFSETIEKYTKAVADDDFLTAKWHCFAYQTEPPYNWLLEASHFENYKHKIDTIFHLQNHLDTMIENLMSELSPEHPAPREHLTFVRKFWENRNTLDKTRIQLRLGFLKSIKTRANHAQKNIWERITQSLGNKAIRLAIEGKIFDTTPEYAASLNLYHQNIRHFFENLNQFKKISDTPLNKPNISQDHYTFYEEEGLIQFLKEGDLTPNRLNTLHQNLKNISEICPNTKMNDYLEKIQIYLNAYYHFNLLFQNFRAYSHHDRSLFPNDFKTHFRGIKESILSLSKSYKDFILNDYSIKNQTIEKKSANSSPEETFLKSCSNARKSIFDLYKIISKTLQVYLEDNPILKLQLNVHYETLQIAQGSPPITFPTIPIPDKEKIKPEKPRKKTRQSQKIESYAIFENYKP